jgi:hypothetical protein
MEDRLMSCMKTTVLVTCATILLTAGFSSAQDTSSRLTRVTFSEAVELPCGTLAAGTYSFRLADARGEGGRHTVQILDDKAQKLVCTAMAIPARRLQTDEVNVITFRESAATAPAALRFWYYPNDIMGQEFAYPKERALAIAAASGESVLAIDDNQITRVEPTPPTPAPEAPAIAEETPPVGTSGRTLPRTASELPLVGLIGLLALGGALLARTLRATA